MEELEILLEKKFKLLGTLIEDVKQKIIIISPKGKEEEAISRLSRVGFDNVVGFLEGGFDNWVNSSR